MKGAAKGCSLIRNDEDKRRFLTEPFPVSHPDDVLLTEWVDRIRDGERGPEVDGIARAILNDFALRHFLGVPQSPVTLGWLADALTDITDYADPLTTLGLLPRPKKRPADPQHGWDVACWVAVTQQRGYSRAQAIQMAAELFATDESNVRKLLKKGPSWMNPDKPVWEDYFQLRKRPLPNPQTGKK